MHSTQNKDDEAVSLAGVTASSSPVRRSGQPVILQFQKPIVAAASMALEDASDPVDGFESIGSLAVRLVADWSLPRIHVCRRSGAKDQSPSAGLSHGLEWEEDRP